ncbi:hypothetical protein HMPREF3293_01674 [Christensenella minuta]|uniref:Uncharacterized protein n=1 Tax=Christensenella minuta TaxID=626937 RepID=A0A136Q479_9FIRM|nr:hypothetical protein HMPREF3293_01674 [Christensenella minuta]
MRGSGFGNRGGRTGPGPQQAGRETAYEVRSGQELKQISFLAFFFFKRKKNQDKR